MLVAFFSMCLGPANAQYPNRTVKIVVPYGAGGPTDLIARVLASGLADKWGKPVVVENRVGAGGNIGSDIVAKSTGDGYTLLVVPSGLLVINPWLFDKMPFDPQRDLTAISLLGAGPNIMFVNTKLPVQNLEEYIRYARENPSRSNFSSPGIGTIPHLAGEMLMQQTGIKITHVPYSGAPQSMVALINGDADMMIDTPLSLTYAKAGKIRPIAVLSKNRFSGAPSVPTVSESGHPEMIVDAWYGLLAPPRMAPELAQQIRTDAASVLLSADAKKRLEFIGFEPVMNTSDVFSKAIATESAQWGNIFRKAGIRPTQ